MLAKEKSYNLLMKIFIYFFLFVIFISNKSYSSTKENIINNLIKTKNLSFDFKQKIQNKKEKGNCTIRYPKQIYCLYEGDKKKELVSNGKSLVIKINNSNNSYIYSLKSTPLNYILDKKFLLNEIKYLQLNNKNKDIIELNFLKNNYEISLFFDKKTFDIAGWKTIDIYQNEVIFQIENIKKNQVLDKKKFKLPKLD